MIADLFQINDWEIKKFLRVVLAVQLAILGLIGLAAFGFDIPILRKIVGFIYLTFAPGLVILRVLKLHKLGAVKTLLYSVGLSLAFIMFLGLFMNSIYPHIGISKPISTLPLIVTLTTIMGLMCFIAYRRDRDFQTTSRFEIHDILSPPVLLLMLLPLLAVVGTQIVHYYQNNIPLLVMICLIALVPILAIYTKFIPERLYPLAIYCIALALLWQLPLVFKYLVQWDSFGESYYFNLVNGSGIWNFEINKTYNAMLSITILPSIFSQLLDMSGTAIFKIIYPVWFAFAPLGLYEIYKRFNNNYKKAFLAVFFVMSVYVFYLEIPSIGRQMVAEIFYVSLVMLIIDREVSISKTALFMIFGASLIVSLYSLSYLFIGFMVISLIILYFLKEKRSRMTIYSITLLAVMCLAWYMYVSNAAPLSALARLGKHIYDASGTDLFNIYTRDFASVLTATPPSVLHWTNRILLYLMLLFMAIGGLTVISSLKRKEVGVEYASLTVGNYILLGLCIAIPFFSSSLNMSRMFHIASLILAPFCISGAEIVFRSFSRFIQLIRHSTSYITISRVSTGATITLLVLYFLFNTRLPFEIAKDPDGRSSPLAYGHLINNDKAIAQTRIIQFWSNSPTDQDVYAAYWIQKNRNNERGVYASYWKIGVPALLGYGMIPPEQTYNLTPKTRIGRVKGNYIFLNYVNVVLGYGTTRTMPGQPDPELGDIYDWHISEISPLLESSKKVYTNGSSEIYLVP